MSNDVLDWIETPESDEAVIRFTRITGVSPDQSARLVRLLNTEFSSLTRMALLV